MKSAAQFLLHLISILLPIVVIGQNLVPNSGFENFNQCPTGISGIFYSTTYSSFPSVQDWTNPLINTSPDYLHTCAAASSGVHVPEGTFGHEWPHGGNAYAGINAWQGAKTGNVWTLDYREYLQTKLLQPLA